MNYLEDLKKIININSYSKNPTGVNNVSDVMTSWLNELEYENIIYTRETIGNHNLYKSKKNNQTQYFTFDSFAGITLNDKLKNKSDISFVLTPTSSKRALKSKTVSWEMKNQDLSPKLIIEHIPKRREALPQVSNAKLINENGKIKLIWDNPKHSDLKGVKVIKNPYRDPFSTHDGQKLYAGMDQYTYDDFGALDIDKYYALFTYDEVPNYSKPIIIKYEGK